MSSEEGSEKEVQSFIERIKGAIDREARGYIYETRMEVEANEILDQVCTKLRCSRGEVLERVDKIRVENINLREELKGVDIIQKAKVHYFPLLQYLVSRAQERGDMEMVRIINDWLISGSLP